MGEPGDGYQGGQGLHGAVGVTQKMNPGTRHPKLMVHCMGTNIAEERKKGAWFSCP